MKPALPEGLAVKPIRIKSRPLFSGMGPLSPSHVGETATPKRLRISILLLHQKTAAIDFQM